MDCSPLSAGSCREALSSGNTLHLKQEQSSTHPHEAEQQLVSKFSYLSVGTGSGLGGRRLSPGRPGPLLQGNELSLPLQSTLLSVPLQSGRVAFRRRNEPTAGSGEVEG